MSESDYVPLEVLEHYKEVFSKQEGRKYPCSNQIVRCAVVTDDRNKAIEFMSNKVVTEKRERKESIEWFLDNGEHWIWRHWSENCRGYRFYKVAVDTNINPNIFKYIILPCCSNYCCSFEII